MSKGTRLKRVQVFIGSLTGVLFLFHMGLMSCLLLGWVKYHSWYPKTGFVLLGALGVHSVLSIYCLFSKKEKQEDYQIGKIVTGLLIGVLLAFHGRDYTSPIVIGNVTIGKGIGVLAIELSMLCFSVVHLRLGVKAIYEALNVREQMATRIITMVSCLMATILLIFGGYAIWQYIM